MISRTWILHRKVPIEYMFEQKLKYLFNYSNALEFQRGNNTDCVPFWVMRRGDQVSTNTLSIHPLLVSVFDFNWLIIFESFQRIAIPNQIHKHFVFENDYYSHYTYYSIHPINEYSNTVLCIMHDSTCNDESNMRHSSCVTVWTRYMWVRDTIRTVW